LLEALAYALYVLELVDIDIEHESRFIGGGGSASA
jgi:hypothetical protein